MSTVQTEYLAAESYKMLFDAMPQACLVLAPDAPKFTILGANQAYLNATNTREEVIAGKGVFEAFPQNPDDTISDNVSSLEASLRQVLHNKASHKMDSLKYDIPHKNGGFEVRWWSLNNIPVLGQDGSVQYIMHTNADITETMMLKASVQTARVNEAEAAAKVNQALGAKSASDNALEYLQQVIDTSQTGIFLFTPVKDDKGNVIDFIFRMANDRLASYVGQTKDVVTGTLGSRFFAGYKTNGLFEKYSDTYYTGKQNHFEFHYDTDGIDVWLDIMSTKLNDEVLVTFSDHTILKQLQQQNEASIEELRRSNGDLEQFAYIASHDLQEPLRKIQAFGEMLKNRYEEQLGDSGKDMISRMQNASDRMKILIDDLLTYSRVSSQQWSFQSVDLNEVLKDIQSDMETTIRKEKAIIQISKLQPVQGNRLQLSQLFQNLISNAIKFKKPDSEAKIKISSSVIHPSFVKNVLLPDSKTNYQHITVEDEGIGFEPEYAERIFQIFQRLHGRSDYPGTGVGLSIVRKVAERHKGVIVAESELGKGSVFHIYLPLDGEHGNNNHPNN